MTRSVPEDLPSRSGLSDCTPGARGGPSALLALKALPGAVAFSVRLLHAAFSG